MKYGEPAGGCGKSASDDLHTGIMIHPHGAALIRMRVRFSVEPAEAVRLFKKSKTVNTILSESINDMIYLYIMKQSVLHEKEKGENESAVCYRPAWG